MTLSFNSSERIWFPGLFVYLFHGWRRDSFCGLFPFWQHSWRETVVVVSVALGVSVAVIMPLQLAWLGAVFESSTTGVVREEKRFARHGCTRYGGSWWEFGELPDHCVVGLVLACNYC